METPTGTGKRAQPARAKGRLPTRLR
jgi:hypothetical protein